MLIEIMNVRLMYFYLELSEVITSMKTPPRSVLCTCPLQDVATSQIRFVNGFRLDLVSKVGQICERYNIEARRRVDEMKSTASHQRRVLEDHITALTSRGAELERLIGSSDSFAFLNVSLCSRLESRVTFLQIPLHP